MHVYYCCKGFRSDSLCCSGLCWTHHFHACIGLHAMFHTSPQLVGWQMSLFYACTGAEPMCFSRQSSGVMGNPDLQLRTDSLGLTPLLAPLSPVPAVRHTPQPQHVLQSRKLPSSGGSGEGLPIMVVEVAAFDCCSSSNDGSGSSMTGRQDSKLIGESFSRRPVLPVEASCRFYCLLKSPRRCCFCNQSLFRTPHAWPVAARL